LLAQNRGERDEDPFECRKYGQGNPFWIGPLFIDSGFHGSDEGGFAIGLVAVGIALMAGLFGYCPIYHLMGVDTGRKETDGRAGKVR